MLVENGYLVGLRSGELSFADDGSPVVSPLERLSRVPCQWRIVQESPYQQLPDAGGSYPSKVVEAHVSGTCPFYHHRVELLSACGCHSLGVYRVEGLQVASLLDHTSLTLVLESVNGIQ